MLSLDIVLLTLLVCHLSSIGLTWILMYGTILDPPRNWLTRWKFFKDLFRCAQCTGFWSGIFHLVCVMAICIAYGGYWSNTLEQILLRFAILSLPLQTSGVCYMFDHVIIGVAKGVGDMLFYKNKQLKSHDDQLNVLQQDDSRTYTTTSNVPLCSPGHTPGTTSTSNSFNPAKS